MPVTISATPSDGEWDRPHEIVDSDSDTDVPNVAIAVAKQKTLRKWKRHIGLTQSVEGSALSTDDDGRLGPIVQDHHMQGGHRKSKLLSEEFVDDTIGRERCLRDSRKVSWSFADPDEAEDIKNQNLQVLLLVAVPGGKDAGRKAILKALAGKQGFSSECDVVISRRLIG